MSRIVTQVLRSGLADLAPARLPGADETLRCACRSALERLWNRRDALARSLQALPTADAAEGCRTPPRTARVQTGQERSVVELDAAASLVALVLRSGRLSAQPANTPAADDAHWEHCPRCWAMALCRVVQIASPEHAVRIELMRIAARLLCPHFVDAGRRPRFDGDTRRRDGDVQDKQDTAKNTRVPLHRVPSVQGEGARQRPAGRRIWGVACLCLSACLLALLLGCGGHGGTSSPATPAAPAEPSAFTSISTHTPCRL
ncbi:hypothetical protein [Piscinibacter sp. XHJ-5]|uniref:hypothetical protein n=1 Tax=Piscinibacter sp. XHJ-5 TaxID=3037797 RepID=UPI0024534549|nr:hypothetical protein [Piscinibacter sp. XHJ-5]